ncbi:helix-turn-helix domain-containing protein [Streptomyces sp. CL12-4]|uniref:helix-turn-helix domain-containing protein n=1 Tax=Streptomyces sp. CL12-4 TaxID=2810306 RepID=UPI0035AB9801
MIIALERVGGGARQSSHGGTGRDGARATDRTSVSRKEQVRAVLRVRISLAPADGLSNGAIARELAVHVNTVRTWRGRFAVQGPDWLEEASRSGRPKTYGAQVALRIAATATSAPPHPEAAWSHRAIAAKVASTGFGRHLRFPGRTNLCRLPKP